MSALNFHRDINGYTPEDFAVTEEMKAALSTSRNNTTKQPTEVRDHYLLLLPFICICYLLPDIFIFSETTRPKCNHMVPNLAGMSTKVMLLLFANLKFKS